jgi:hypothetical protein
VYNTAIKEVQELDKELKKTDIESDRDFYDELYVGKIETLLEIKESVKNSILEEAINRDELEILKYLGLFEIKVFNEEGSFVSLADELNNSNPSILERYGIERKEEVIDEFMEQNEYDQYNESDSNKAEKN